MPSWQDTQSRPSWTLAFCRASSTKTLRPRPSFRSWSAWQARQSAEAGGAAASSITSASPMVMVVPLRGRRGRLLQPEVRQDLRVLLVLREDRVAGIGALGGRAGALRPGAPGVGRG